MHDSKVSSSSPERSEHETLKECHDANVIIVTTHIINHLIQKISKDSIDSTKDRTLEKKIKFHQATVLSGMIYLLSKILFTDRSRLELGLSESSKNNRIIETRGILGRAILSCVVGSVTVISVLSEASISDTFVDIQDSKLKTSTQWIQTCMWSNLILLENLISGLTWNDFGKSIPVIKSTQGTIPTFSSGTEDNLFCMNTTQALVWNYLWSVMAHCADMNWITNETFGVEAVFNEQEGRDGLTEEYEVLYKYLFATDLNSSSKIVDIMSSYEQNIITFENWTFIQTLSAVAFVKCSNGQERTLQMLSSMLDHDRNANNNWDFIMAPRPIIQQQEFVYSLTITEESSIDEKKKRGRPRKSKECSNPERYELSIPGNVALVTFAARIINMSHDSGSLCASRVPDKEIDRYCQLIQDKGNERIGIKSAPQKLGMSSEASRLMYLLLKTHHRCLQENIREPDLNFLSSSVFPLDKGPSMGYLLLNENFGSENMSRINLKRDVVPHSKFYPQVHRVIEMLARSAGSSAESSSTFDGSESDIASNLIAIGSAFALKYGIVICERHRTHKNDENLSSFVILDTKLCSMATKELLNALNTILSSSNDAEVLNDGSAKTEESMLQSFSLTEPLIPNLPQFDPAGMCRHGQFLSFFIRAMIPRDSKKKQSAVAEKAIQTLINTLLRMVGCYYAVIDCDLTDTEIVTTRTRNVVDCLNTLRRCMCIAPTVASKREVKLSKHLRSYLRPCCLKQPTVIRHFIELGQNLQRLIVDQRLDLITNDAVDRNATIQTRHRSEGNERMLWAAHIKLSLTIGRGNAYHDLGNSTSSYPNLLGSITDKLTIFKTFGFIAKRNSTCEQESNHYILYISSLHHALVASNLTTESLPTHMKEAVVERFLCDTFISSICACLKDPFLCQTKIPEDRRMRLLDDSIPLSRKDARLFILAVCRLPRKEQVKTLSRTVKMLDECLTEIGKVEKLRRAYVDQDGISGFLARVIILISTMVDLVGGGKSLSDRLFQQIGRAYYNFPANFFLSAEEDGDINDGYEWYNCENHFMSIFADCETPSLPVVDLSDLTSPLSSKDFLSLSRIYEMALNLGFDSASKDHCHLAFASWNASGKLCGWDPKKWSSEQLSVNAFKKYGSAAKIMSIRDEICNIFTAVENDKNNMPDSFLTEVLKKRGHIQVHGRHNSSTFVKGGVAKCVAILKTMTKDFHFDKNITPSGEFVSMEALVIYLSFRISMFTSSSNEAFLSMIKRKDSNVSADSLESLEDGGAYCDASDESIDSGSGEHVFLEDEEDDESRMDGLCRLHEVCNLIGAAPFHPDWLDSQCRLRPGIQVAYALTLSNDALDALVEFSSKIFTQYLKMISTIFELLKNNEVAYPQKQEFELALVLMSLQSQHANKTLNEGNNGWQEIVCRLCNLDSAILESILYEVPHATSNSIKETFCPHSALRIHGKLQDSVSLDSWIATLPEYRAGAEWEMILSETLLGCSTQIDNDNLNLSDDVQQLLKETSRWSGVLHVAVSGMVTISSLLRMSLNNGKGREKHSVNRAGSSDSHCNTTSRSENTVKEHESRFTVSKTLHFLAELCSCGFLSDRTQQCAKAVANQLLRKDEDFDSILKVRAIKSSLNGLELIAKNKYLFQNHKDDVNIACESMIKVIELISIDGVDNYQNNLVFGVSCSKLLSCLGVPNATSIFSIADVSGVDILSILSHKSGSYSPLFLKWNEGIQSSQLELLMNICMRQNSIGLNTIVRLKAITILKMILETEGDSIIKYRSDMVEDSILKSSIVQCWNGISRDAIQDLVQNEICNRGSVSLMDHKISHSLSRELSFIIAYLSGSQNDNPSCQIVLQEIRDHLHDWITNQNSEHIQFLLYVLATRFGEISTIGDELLSLAVSDNINEFPGQNRALIVLETFYRFIHDTKLKIQSGTFARESENKNKKYEQCTYVSTGVDFSEQHWYNCYTCGLIWDKGCCSICAQICHKGHDVGYSRKSSFFCDCGAESSSNGNGACKCINPQDDKSVVHFYDDKAPGKICDKILGFTKESDSRKDVKLLEAATHIASHYFPSVTLSSINHFAERARQNGLTKKLFDLFDSCVEEWDRAGNLNSLTINSHKDGSNQTAVGSHISICDTLDLQLHCRCGKSMDVTYLDSGSFAFVRGTKPNSINPRLSTDCSTDRRKGTFLSKNDLKRDAMTVDNRGRIIIADACSILFFPALPLVNTRHANTPTESNLDRTELGIIGSVKVPFNIVGMNICREDDSKLAVWGSSTASVFFLSSSCEKIDARIDLSLDLEDDEFERSYIFRSEWIDESAGQIVVVFGSSFVKFFDIRTVESCANSDNVYICRPSSTYILNYEDVKMCAGVVIPCRDDNLLNETIEPSLFTNKTFKIGLLFDTGRMCFFNIVLHNGYLKDKGESYIDYGDPFPFPTTGISRSVNISVGLPGSTSLSFGKGTSLIHLKQSDILLYKCISSSLIAFVLDKNGKIIGSFELLPHVINHHTVGNDHPGGSITGPFTNWIELGIVERNGVFSYRASFVGRSITNNQPRLLCLEFNQYQVKVSEIKAPSSNRGLGVNILTSYEGICAFSGPYVSGTENGFTSVDGKVVERGYIVLFTSNGSLLMFGEEPDEKSPVCGISNLDCERDNLHNREVSQTEHNSNPSSISVCNSQPIFPVTIFEDLINISERDDLQFIVEGVDHGPKLGKRRLNMNEHVKSKAEGYTLILSFTSSGLELEQENEIDDIHRVGNIENSSVDNNVPSFLVIAGIRILLGSSKPECMPRKVVILGRPVQFTQGMKRWYDIPFTDEEILIGARTGFISVCFGGSFDSARDFTAIDSIEVYAQERSKMSNLFPVSKHAFDIFSTNTSMAKQVSSPTYLSEEEKCRRILNASILAVTHIFQLFDQNQDQSQLNLQTLKRLIQITALHSVEERDVRYNVVALLGEVKNDEQGRQTLLDEGTLLGISEVLNYLSALSMDKEDESVEDAMEVDNYCPDESNKSSPKCVSTLNDCIASALYIIKNRPSTYRACIHNLTGSMTIDQSISQEAMKVFNLFSQTMYVSSIVPALVELALLEAIIIDEYSSGTCQGACLDFLSTALKSEDKVIVKECCQIVADIFRKAFLQSDAGLECDSGVDAPPVRNAYQCDGCNMVPIEGTRYSHEEGHDIDLCRGCYDEGYSFANNNMFSRSISVVINGKKLRLATQQMTCAHMQQMQPVSENNELGSAMTAEGEDENSSQLQMIHKMNLETKEKSSSSLRLVHQQVFNKLLRDLSVSLSSVETPMVRHPLPVVQLLLTMVFETCSGEDEVTFGRQICDSLCENILLACTMISKLTTDDEGSIIFNRKRFCLVFCLRAMTCLLLKSQRSEEEKKQSSTKIELQSTYAQRTATFDSSNGKAQSKLTCDVHGVPVVRRRCSNGENKGRRFYICGMQRKHRCAYFRWVDKDNLTTNHAAIDRQRTLSSDDSISSNSVSEEVNLTLQPIIWDSLSAGSPPLHAQLCNIVQVSVKNFQSSGCNHTSKFISNQGKSPSCNIDALLLKSDSQSRKKNSERDDQDGVFLGLKKLVWHRHHIGPNKDASHISFLTSSNETSIVESSLELLSYATVNASKLITNTQSEAWEVWFAPLCEIISTSPSVLLRAQAKKILKRLCGGRQAIYHKVRYHYVFGFHFMKLLVHCKRALRAGLDVKEKARRCGTNWMSSELSWETLCSGGLIGVHDLISEDVHSSDNAQNVNKILDELISMTKNRRNHWRQFCASHKLPKRKPTEVLDERDDDSFKLVERPPICLMFWLACSLPTVSQVKIFELMASAMNKDKLELSVDTQLQGDQYGILSTDTGTDLEVKQPRKGDDASVPDAGYESPEAILFNGENGLTSSDVYSFIILFVLNGNNHSLRAATSTIACCLVRSLPSHEMDYFFKTLSGVCLRDIGILGCRATEYLQFLNACFSFREIIGNIDVSHFTRVVVACFTKQTATFQETNLSMAGRDALLLEIDKPGSDEKLTFDLATCIFCHSERLESFQVSNKSPESIWVADQMTGMKKTRLETSFLQTVCTEFSKFVQLKSRLVVSEVHLSISDPRGRYAKTIGIFFSPRPVNDVHELKKADYAELWQKCGTLSLSRGACRSSCRFSIPIIAANLKFEFEEFYEKDNNSRSSNSALVIHCPRCTRVVNNSHGGVCAHCGEVAFQCRKCRHINYDRLDAFFCIECGYCASGTFTYDITSALATTAVAITNDDDLEQSIRYLRVSMKKMSESKSVLTKRISKCTRENRYDFDGLSKYCSPLKRSLLGEFPKINSKEQVNNNSSGGKKRRLNGASMAPSSSRSEPLSAANRARSLLSLAHQLRTETSDSDERPHRDILLQQALLNSSGNFDMIDETDSDVLGLINGCGDGNILHSEMPDPLSRLVANIQARVRGNSNRHSGRRSGANNEGHDNRNDDVAGSDATSEMKDTNTNVITEYTQLYQQLKEAERDYFELHKRIAAWKQLNIDKLVDHGAFNLNNFDYVPVHCSSCSSKVSRNILSLAITLFSENIEESEKALDINFIHLLFEESTDICQNLLALKRSLLITIAMKSDLGSNMILDEMQKRLQIGREESSAAEVLGQLLENDFNTVNSFVSLAWSTINRLNE